jgi:UDP-N-acetylmuramate: L-alanyl-gamma-D-glutamyl-meso-diaminopimelate ligase
MQIRKAHFIGIGGVGMSATAKLLKDSGVIVTGSDEEVYPPISTLLEKEGIDYQTPYRAENIPEDADLIVIGKNAKLVPETNEEVAAAYASGKKIQSFPEVLSERSAGSENVIVAGSYGKSTSTALLAHCLLEAQLDPSFFIGAVPLSPTTNARRGSGKLFILEGDEYPSSNTDTRSKFLHLHPSHLLITPLAHDHFNIFPTPADYLKPFFELLTLPPADATIVICVDGSLSDELILHAKRPITTYGLSHGDFYAADILWGEHTSFEIMHRNEKIVRVEMAQLGEHSIQNIVGAAAFLFTRQLVTPEQFADAVTSFKGLMRRLDRKSDKTSIPIFEGFGSSYEKARSAIDAIKKHFSGKRLIVLFEPNTFSWRNRASLPQYEMVFAGADKVYLFEPPHDGKDTQLSLAEIAVPVKAAGIDVTILSNTDDALQKIDADLQANDCVLFLSSGAMGGLIESIPKLAEQKFPK